MIPWFNSMQNHQKKGLVPTEEGGNYFDNKIGGVMKYKYYKRVDSHM